MISDTGFFSDGKWHEMAQAMRSEHGEAVIAAVDREIFAGMLNPEGKAIFDEAALDAYWAPFERGDGARATLEFYRSMDFEKLERWDGKLGELGVPTLILWGADDPFSPLADGPPLRERDPGVEADPPRRRRALHLGRAA